MYVSEKNENEIKNETSNKNSNVSMTPCALT